MEKILCGTVPEAQRAQMLRDSCDKVEEVGYMKPYTPDEIVQMKDELAEASIQINEIEEEKKAEMDKFKARLSPLDIQKKELLKNIKNKAEFVREDCFKFIDHEEGMVGFYNSLGDLIESRPIRYEERQLSIGFNKTGTND